MTKKRPTPRSDLKITSIAQQKRGAQKSKAKNRKSRQQFNISWLYIGLGILIVTGVVFLLVRPKESLLTEIPVSQAFEMYQRGDFFLDVREQQEWEQGHIPNSTHISLDELQNRIGELPKDREIVVVCALGQRSKAGMDILKQAGFDRVTCLSGGIQAWAAEGYPLEKSNN